MAELSIIVPIYNVEVYLPRCIDSILAQTFTDFELILINDGSPDRCAEIMEAYAKKDARIITIHQENQGVSAARNAGLKIATGKYVSFIDPDDYIDKDFLEKLVYAIKETDTQIACCNWDYFYEDNKIEEHLIIEMPYVMCQKDFVKHIFDTPRTVGGSNCNKLFLKNKILELYDESLAICEDNIFLLKYCRNISSGCYVNKSLYHVFQRAESATRKDRRKLLDGLAARESMICIAKDIHKEAGMCAEKDFLDLCYAYYGEFNNDANYQYAMKAWNELTSYIRKNTFHLLCNKEIYCKTKLLYLLKIFDKNLHGSK